MSVDFNASFSGSAETFGAKMTETPASTTNTTLNRLREAGLVEMVGKQRALTPYGRQIAQGL
mgnify:CR=1 FL=1